MGPLHGLPISLKDQFPIKGLETVMGKPTHLHQRYMAADAKDMHRVRGMDRPGRRGRRCPGETAIARGRGAVRPHKRAPNADGSVR